MIAVLAALGGGVVVVTHLVRAIRAAGQARTRSRGRALADVAAAGRPARRRGRGRQVAGEVRPQRASNATRRVRWIVVPCVLALVLAGSGVAAWAYWTASGAGGATAASGSFAAATISVPGAGINTVTVTWDQQASVPPDPAQNGDISYAVERKLAGGSWGDVSSGSCSTDRPYGVSSCSDAPPVSGSYSYRAVARYRSWTATSSEQGPVVFTIDTPGPSGGSVDAAGLVGTGGRYSTSTALSILLDKGTDPSGVAPSGAKLRRSTAPLTSSGDDGSCGSYDASVQVGADDPVSPVATTAPGGQACYRYEYVVADTLGNSTTYTSPDIKIDTSAPGAPALGFSDPTNTHWSDPTLFYRSTAASGAFTLTAAAIDATSGIAAYALPILPAGWTVIAGGRGVNTYSWSAPTPTAPAGTQNVTATNHATLTSPAAGFAMTSDVTPPATGNVTYAGGYYTSPSVSVSFARGTDAGAGVDATSAVLQRAGAPLADGTCGTTYSSFSTLAAGNNPTSPLVDSTVVSGACYQYRYLVSDNVGNQAIYTSANVAKVDSTPPGISRAVVAKTDGSTPGTIRQGGLYYIYAQVDDASTTTVTANTSAFDSGVTAASLVSTGGPWTVGAVTYSHRSTVSLSANTPQTTGVAHSYTVSATDAATNAAVPASYSGTIESYRSVISGTFGLLSHWRLGDGALAADEFTGTAGTLLPAHTGALGNSWTAVSGQPRTALISSGGRLRREAGAGSAQYYTSVMPSSANYLVQADVYGLTGVAGDTVGVVGRQDISGTGQNYYMARYLIDSGEWQLIKGTGGATGVILGSYAQSLTGSVTYRLGLQMNGTAISLLVDGVARVSVADGGIVAAGNAGVRLGTSASTASVSDTTGLHLDNFRITTLAPAAADSAATNDGAFTNGPLLNEPGALVGDSDRATRLDGTADHVNVPDASSLDLGNGPVTLEAWVKRSSAAAISGAMIFFDKGSSGFELAWENATTVFLKARVAYFARWNSTVNDTNWHHVVVTRSGTAANLYVDGANVAGGTITPQTLASNALPLILGAEGGTGGFLAGTIDEFAIYGGALTATQVLDHYRAGTGTG